MLDEYKNKISQHKMRKPMIIMLIIVGILFGGIFLFKFGMGLFIKHYFATHENPPVTVSTTKVGYSAWQPHLQAVGTLKAVQGVNVTAQLGGMVQKIYFTAGATVAENTLLVQQNADPDIAQLHALQANAELAKITYERDKAQYKVKAVSKQQLDSDEQNLKSLQAQVEQQAATVEKLTIRAPFNGRLGISNVNPGQYLNPGDNVVTLQMLDPIYADFYLPQQALAQLSVEQDVIVKTDTFPDEDFFGRITTINPIVDVNTRNVEVQATLPNPKGNIIPGMFVNVEVKTGEKENYLTVPQTAISFNPYGDVAYIVTEEKDKKDKNGKTILIANQVFVNTGETRGDQIRVIQGLKEGDVVVTSGQLKLKNGSHVIINNTVQPSDNPNPSLPNQHDG